MVKKRSRFGTQLDLLAATRGLRQVDMAERLDVTSSYVSSISTGMKFVSPQRIESIAQKLDASEDEVQRMHRAAALDMGFKLDLPDDF